MFTYVQKEIGIKMPTRLQKPAFEWKLQVGNCRYINLVVQLDGVFEVFVQAKHVPQSITCTC
jgi:hypothetical protein